MELKKIYSRKEIAEMYKISVKTLERKLKPFKKMFAFDKRKRIYTETEVNFIKSIFK